LHFMKQIHSIRRHIRTRLCDSWGHEAESWFRWWSESGVLPEIDGSSHPDDR